MQNTYESVASAFGRLSVCYHNCLFDIPELLEEFAKALIGRVVGKPTNEYFGEGGILLGDSVSHFGYVEKLCRVLKRVEIRRARVDITVAVGLLACKVDALCCGSRERCMRSKRILLCVEYGGDVCVYMCRVARLLARGFLLLR